MKALSAVGAVVLALMVYDYMQYHADTPGPLPGTGVLFTGGSPRLEYALSLLEENRIARLFISGVAASETSHPGQLSSRLAPEGDLAGALQNNRMVLGSQAETTLGNAVETACWLGGQEEIDEVLLITSRDHLPRASLVLRQALPRSVDVHRMAAPISTRHWSEIPKFVATWFVTLLPVRMWPGTGGIDCDR